VRSSAPRLGDDTDAVLGELGVSAEQIAALRERKVVA
jgi:formyl-CoA transferase